jgi:hypothetical protein
MISGIACIDCRGRLGRMKKDEEEDKLMAQLSINDMKLNKGVREKILDPSASF